MNQIAKYLAIFIVSLSLVGVASAEIDTESHEIFVADDESEWNDIILESDNIEFDTDVNGLTFVEYDNFEMETETSLEETVVDDWEDSPYDFVSFERGEPAPAHYGDDVKDFPYAVGDTALQVTSDEEGMVQVSSFESIDLTPESGLHHAWVHTVEDTEQRYLFHNMGDNIMVKQMMDGSIEARTSVDDNEHRMTLMTEENVQDGEWYRFEMGQYEDDAVENPEEYLNFIVYDEEWDQQAQLVIHEEDGIDADLTDTQGVDYEDGDHSDAEWRSSYDDAVIWANAGTNNADTSVNNFNFEDETRNATVSHTPEDGDVMSVDRLDEQIDMSVTVDWELLHDNLQAEGQEADEEYEIRITVATPDDQDESFYPIGEETVSVDELGEYQHLDSVTAEEIIDVLGDTEGSEYAFRPAVFDVSGDQEEFITSTHANQFYLESPDRSTIYADDVKTRSEVVETDGESFWADRDIEYNEQNTRGTVMLEPTDLSMVMDEDDMDLDNIHIELQDKEEMDRYPELDQYILFSEDGFDEELDSDELIEAYWDGDVEGHHLNSGNWFFNEFRNVGEISYGLTGMMDFQDLSTYDEVTVVYDFYDTDTEEGNYYFWDSIEWTAEQREIPTYVVGQEVEGDMEITQYLNDDTVYPDYYHEDGEVAYYHATWSVAEVDGDDTHIIEQGDWVDVGEDIQTADTGSEYLEFENEFSETFHNDGQYVFQMHLVLSESEAEPQVDEEGYFDEEFEWKDYEHDQVAMEIFEFEVVSADEPDSPLESLANFFSDIVSGIIDSLTGVFDDGELLMPDLEEPPEVE